MAVIRSDSENVHSDHMTEFEIKLSEDDNDSDRDRNENSSDYFSGKTKYNWTKAE